MASDCERLFRDMAAVKTVFGLPVIAVRTQESGTSTACFHVVVQYPVVGNVPLDVSMQVEGELIWDVKLSASKQREILRTVCALEHELAKRAATLECSPLRFDNRTGQLSGSILASLDPQAETLARWQLDPGGSFRIYVPNQPPRQVASLPAVELGPTPQTARHLMQAIEEHLSLAYPRLSESLQVLPLEEAPPDFICGSISNSPTGRNSP